MMKYVQSILAGVGQVMFQNNAWTGALFVLAILVNAPLMAFGAVLGSAIGMATAKLAGFPEEETAHGLYGFNAVLVGIAMLYFYTPGAATWGMIAAGSIASAFLMRLMILRFPLPAFTAPFVMITWVLLALGGAIHMPAADWTARVNFSDAGIFEGVGQVMFQENAFTGVIFLLAIAVNSHIKFLWALVGSVVGVVMAFILSLPIPMIAAGIFGFNGVLAAIALSGKRWNQGAWPLLGAGLTVPCLALFQHFGIIALTAPFVIVTWLVLVLRRRLTADEESETD